MLNDRRRQGMDIEGVHTIKGHTGPLKTINYKIKRGLYHVIAMHRPVSFLFIFAFINLQVALYIMEYALVNRDIENFVIFFDHREFRLRQLFPVWRQSLSQGCRQIGLFH